MNISRIELFGNIDKKTGLPICFATVYSRPGKGYFTVTITTPDNITEDQSARDHAVDATCQEDIFSMAQCLQFHLDGYKGSNSEVHDYFRLLQYFEK